MPERVAFDDYFDARTGEHSKNGAKPSGYQPPKPLSARDLQAMVMPTVRYIVPDLLPEGLCVLAGKPKLGKSWLALGVSIAVASGGYALGTIAVEKGDVLYLALEDNFRRLKKRMDLMLPNDEWPEGLFLQTEWPRLNAQAVAHIGAWLDDHPTARLVVIDTLAKIRPKRDAKSGAGYAEDYADIEQLQELAAQYQITILLVHHARKAAADDWLDEISGTLGIAGSADGAMVLKRARGEGLATLAVTGRDLDEEKEIALVWDVSICNWRECGTAAEMRLSKERQEIIDLLRSAPLGMGPAAVAADLKKNPGAIRKLMAAMLKDGNLHSVREGVYMVPSPETSVTPGNTFGNTPRDASGETRRYRVLGNTGNTGNTPGRNGDFVPSEAGFEATGVLPRENGVGNTPPREPVTEGGVTGVTGVTQSGDFQDDEWEVPF